MTTNNIEYTKQAALFNFPQRSFWQKEVICHCFQPSWFNRWQFLHYDEQSVRPKVIHLPTTYIALRLVHRSASLNRFYRRVGNVGSVKVWQIQNLVLCVTNSKFCALCKNIA